MFTIDLDNGSISQAYNSGNKFSDVTKKLIAAATADKTITLDGIKIRQEGAEKRLPAKTYQVIN